MSRSSMPSSLSAARTSFIALVLASSASRAVSASRSTVRSMTAMSGTTEAVPSAETVITAALAASSCASAGDTNAGAASGTRLAVDSASASISGRRVERDESMKKLLGNRLKCISVMAFDCGRNAAPAALSGVIFSSTSASGLRGDRYMANPARCRATFTSSANSRTAPRRFRACSSIGQSRRLITAWLGVRVPPGPPFLRS